MADGSVIIDTKMDQSGFNAGIGKMVSKFRSSIGALGNILKKVLIAGLAVFALSIGTILRGVGDSLKELIGARGGALQKSTEELQGKFVELRASIAAAFLPLVEAAIPYIKQFVDWLIRGLNYIGMMTAAFMGQKQVLQVIPGSAAKLAKSTKDTAKAAKDALAAFDQINVLQQDAAKAQEESPATVSTQMVPVTDEVLSKVQAIKDEINKWVADPKGSFLSFIYWDNWVKFVQQKWQEFKNFIFLDDWLAFIKNSWNGLWKTVSDEWEKIKTAFKDGGLGAAIQEAFRGLFDALIKIVIGFVALFNVEFAQKLATIANNPLEFIRTKFVEVFTGIQNFALATVNNIIGFINNLVASILGAIAQLSGLGTAGASASVNLGGVGGTGGRVPHLANGAVIPPNAAFTAVVGDQTHGTNVEAPLETIKQAVREVLGNDGGSTADITLYLDGEVIYKNQQRISRRRGPSLLSGGTV